MKKPPALVLNAAGLVLALGAGILIGRAGHSADDSDGAGTARDGVPSRADARFGGDRRDAATARRGRSGDAEARGTLVGGVGDLQSVLDSASRLERTQKLLAFLDRLPTEQFAEVYAELANSPQADLRGSERSLILQAWAERDPGAAIAYIQDNEGNDWERETVLGTWATSDPQGAIAWALAAEDEGRINNWVLGAMRGVAATNPELARDFLVSMEAGETRERSLRDIQRYVTQFGYDYAESWITGISDGDLQNQAARRLADNLAELDPAKAGSWNASIADTNTRRDVSETVADRWARQDLASARDWVERLPEDTRTEAAEGVARHYARQDPAAAAEWLAGLGSNPDLDGAKRVLIEESFRRDPQTSLEFVANLADERARQGYYSRYLRDWMRRDEAAARSWTEANAGVLPERVVERTLR